MRHCVYVFGYIVSVVGEVEFLEEVVLVVQATSAVFRKRVEVKGVVGCLREFAVLEDLTAEPGVKGVEEG